MTLENNSDYKVDFCNDMTMSYVDHLGLLKFVFEVGSERRPKALFLYRGAVDELLGDVPKTPSNSDRIDLAFGRVVAYLQSSGYEVDIIE